MNLSIVRTTESGKESLNIKDVSEGIAYAVLRRFLPDQKDLLTTEPVQSKVQEVEVKIAPPEDVEGFPVPEPAPPANEAGTSDAPKQLIRTVDTKTSVKAFIKATQEKVRKELQESSDITTDSSGVKQMTKSNPSTSTDKALLPPTYPPKTINQNGLLLYTAEVICGACGHEGSRLTLPTNLFVKCRACDQKLKLERMYDKQPFEANKAGFAFKANEPFVHYREQKALREEMVAKGTND